MIDYSEHLTQMDKLTKQMREALRKNDFTSAHDLSIMLLGETRLLSVNLKERKREQESQQS